MILSVCVATVALLAGTAQQPTQPRHEIPKPSALKEAEKLIKEVFKEDYAKKAPEDRRGLARMLLQQGLETKDDLVAVYVLLQEARTIASETGDAETAVRAAVELGRCYELDVMALRSTTLAAVGQNARNPDDLGACALQMFALADDAARSLDLVMAEKILASAATLARNAKNVILVARIDSRSKQLSAQKSRLSAVKKAQETLAKNAEDVDANGVVGAFVCFSQEDWARGLPLLAKGPKNAAKDAAELDLGQPNEPAKQVAVGDAWWTVSESAPEEHRKSIKRRASIWYAKARTGLTGLVKAKIDKRLAESPLPEPAAPPDTDAASLEAWKPTPPLGITAPKSTLKEAVAQLSLVSNYPIEMGDVDPNARVTLQVEGMGFMAALDSLCRAAGVNYAWNDEGTQLRLTKQKWLDTAAAGFGPFLLLGRVGKAPDPGKVALWLYLDWEPDVKPVWYEITIEGASSDTGSPVKAASLQLPSGLTKDGNLDQRFRPRSIRSFSRREHQKDYYLLDPAPGQGKRLSSVRGKVDVFLPMKWSRVRFESPTNGVTSQVDGHQITLNMIAPRKPEDPWHISFGLDMTKVAVEKRFALYGASLNARGRFVNAAGRPLSSEPKGNSGGASFGTREGFKRGDRSFLVKGLPGNDPPKLAEFDLITEVWSRTYPFELRDVPYPTP